LLNFRRSIVRRIDSASSFRGLFFPVLAPITVGVLSVQICTGAGAAGAEPTKAPAAPLRPVTDDYFGTQVVDPYRYMENMKDPEVDAWFKAQNDYTRATLARIPGREALLSKIKQLDESALARVFDVQRLPGQRYFYQKRLASEEVSRIYVRDGLAGQEKALVDPTAFVKA